MTDARDLKLALGTQAKDIIAQGLRIDLNERTGLALCPFHTEKTPSFSWYEEGLMFKCFGCGTTIDIFDYYTQHENMSFIQAKEKVSELTGIQIHYVKKREPLVSKATNPKDHIYKFFDSRGIKKETVDYWRIGEKKVDFAKVGEKTDIKMGIVFPCFDENDVLIHETYRSSTKQIKQNLGTEAILYGMWHINTSKTLCICEGQIDAMAIWQSGYKNVVSVPAGANNYQFLIYNLDWLHQFDDIVIWADNDDPGRKLASVIKSKFNNVRVLCCDDELKDANDMLLKSGSKSIMEFLTREPELPVGAIYLSEQSYNTGKVAEEDRIETGFKELDRHVKDIRVEEFTIVFGRDGEGKSTFISQLITHRVLHDKKTFLFSGELGLQAIQEWMYKQIVGENRSCYNKIEEKYGDEYVLKPGIVKAIQKYIGKNIIMLDRRKKLTTKELIENMKILATRNQVKFFVIDNLQSALEENASSLNSDQSNFAEDLRMFAVTHKVSVMLVAHPRKSDELDTSKKEVESGNLAKDDISGTKNMSNKAHNIISVERDFDARKFDLIVTLLKDKRTAGRKSFKYHFSKNSFRYFSAETPELVESPWKKYYQEEATLPKITPK